MMDHKPHGQITVKVAETLSGYYESKGYDVLYDHDSTKENVGKIVSWFGDKYGRESELSQLDIAIVEKGSDKALALIEIEETNDTPKTFMGDLFGVLLGDHISFREERIFSMGEYTTLIVLGKSKVTHKKRNEYLREKGLNIKLSLSTGNSVIGNMVIDTFADEKGLYALLSSVLDRAFKGKL
jgi:hypothetical protein